MKPWIVLKFYWDGDEKYFEEAYGPFTRDEALVCFNELIGKSNWGEDYEGEDYEVEQLK